MADRIVYLRVSNGGGVDGRDHTDKGGRVLDADFKEMKVDAWSHIEKRVVDDAEGKKIFQRLEPLDRLLIAHHLGHKK